MAVRDESFAEVYDEEIWHVYGFFGYRLHSRELAEDLTQTTFERALKAWSRFDRERASPRTWLISIARNLLVDHYRREGSVHVEPLPEEEAGNAQLGGTGDDISLGVSPELEVALGTLGERERELIALRFGGDLSGPEIAELTGLTLANVQQILSRSLRQMRKELEGTSADATRTETG